MLSIGLFALTFLTTADTDSYNIFKAPAGTRIYASPDLVAGETVDLRSDLWSLGVIMNEICTAYRHVASRCIRRDRMKRYGAASEVKRDILGEGARKVRMIIGAIVLIGIMTALAAGLMQDRNTAGTHEFPEQETARDSEMPDPENIVSDTPPEVSADRKKTTDDKMNAEELEELLNDAARSIL